jgi:hypothetical protein
MSFKLHCRRHCEAEVAFAATLKLSPERLWITRVAAIASLCKPPLKYIGCDRRFPGYSPKPPQIFER